MSWNKSQRARAWTDYWHQGHRHSLPGDFKDHYGAATRLFWRQAINGLPKNAVILELGCGNGSLIRWLLDEVDSTVSIVGVDLAKLDTRWLTALSPDQRQRVTVHQSCDVAKLNATFFSVDLIVSQYALEYFASDPIWERLEGAVNTGTSFAGITHAKGAVPYTVALAEVAHINWILANGGIIQAAKRALPFAVSAGAHQLAGATNKSQHAAAAQTSLKQSLSAMQDRAQSTAYPDVLMHCGRTIIELMTQAPQLGLQRAMKGLKSYRESLSQSLIRATELTNYALTEDLVGQWQTRFEQKGLVTCRKAQIVEGQHWIGTGIHTESG